MIKYFFLLISCIGITVFAGYDYDGTAVLFRAGHNGEYITQMPGVKRSEFSILDTEMNDSNIYGKDNIHVYFQGRIVPHADPKTFQLIGPESFKDAKHVYIGMSAVEGADPATFSFFDDNSGNGKPSFDKNGFFIGTRKIDSPVNMKNMERLGSWVWDDRNVYWFDTSYDFDFVKIDFLRPQSMGVLYTSIQCIKQDGDTYCPNNWNIQDAQGILKVDKENIDIFLNYFTELSTSVFSTPDSYKKVLKYIDTPDERTILQKNIQDEFLDELTSESPKNKTLFQLGLSNFLIENYFYLSN